MQEKALQEEELEMTSRKQWLSYITERGSHMKMAKAVDYLKKHKYGRHFFHPLMYKTKVRGGGGGGGDRD